MPVADPRIAAAAGALAQAIRDLRTIRRRALGGNYDQPTFDRAVAACRLAEAAVRAARQELDAAGAAARVSEGAAVLALPSIAEPTRPDRVRQRADSERREPEPAPAGAR